MSGALEGIRILELSRVGTAEFATMMLADMGADVLKVETPPSIAPPGFGSSPPPGDEYKRAASYINRNKRSICLNLKDPRAQEIMHKLADESDALVEGFRPGVLQRLNCGYDTLSQRNPGLIYCALSGFGQDGPYKNYPAHDINYLSLAGVLNLIGRPDDMPAIPLNLIADYAGAALHAAVGVLLALIARQRTGRGQFVDVSYLDTSFALLAAAPPFQAFLEGGMAPKRGAGVFSGNYAYYATYKTKDNKMISIGCTEPWLWHNLCDAISRPDLKKLECKPEDFSQPASEEHSQARAELQEIFNTRTRDEWYEMLTAADVCVGMVYEPPEVFSDPQLRHRGMALKVAEPELGEIMQVGPAIKLSDTPGSVRSKAPFIGQHTDDILRSLNYDDETMTRLREESVVA